MAFSCRIIFEGRGSSFQAHFQVMACMVEVLACARHGHTHSDVKSPKFKYV